MVANNLIEIYTLIFAWNMYGAIWDVLAGTGLALIPFVVAVVTSFVEGYENGDSASDIVSGIEQKVVAIVLVLILCVIPYRGWGVDLATLRYDIPVNDCNPPANLQGAGDATGTATDGQFAGLAGLTVYRPVAWSLVELVSSAVTNTTVKSMQCVNNYDFMLLRIANTTLQDPTIRDRVMDFYEICYKAAYARFKENPVVIPDNVAEVDDVDWLGSRILLNAVDEYYRHPDAYMTNMQKYGFTRQTAIRDSDLATSSGANPYCYEVWLGEQGPGVINAGLGLRQLILNDIPNDEAGDLVQDWLDWGFMIFGPNAVQQAEKEDLLIKAIIQADAANLSSKTDLDMSGTLDADRGWGKAIYDMVVGSAGAITGVDEFLQASAIRQVIKIVGPIVLALMQMILIFSSPFVMIFGNFRLTAFVALSISYFGLEFINAIWAAAFYMDNHLLAYYVSEARWFDNPVNSALLTAVTGMSTIFLPAMWLSILAYSGSGMLRGIGAMGVGGGVAMGSHAFRRGINIRRNNNKPKSK